MDIDLPTFTVTTFTPFGDTRTVETDDLSVAYEFANGCTDRALIYMDGELIDTVEPCLSTDPYNDDLGLLAVASLLF